MKKFLLHVTTCVTLIAALSGIAYGNVIYDVTVNYQDGYQYTFAMEFANATGTKSATDLIGGDFSGESFSLSGTPWIPGTDDPPSSLSFDPSSPTNIVFIAADVFNQPSTLCFNSTQTESSGIVTCPGLQTIFDALQITVVERTREVPTPSTLFLIALGLTVLWPMSRITRRRQLATSA